MLRSSNSEYSSVGDKISSVPKGTAAMAVQYREDTAGTSGETNFSGVHKEAVQPEASVLMPASPLQLLLKNLVPQSPRGLACETRARKNNNNKVSYAAQSAGTDRRIV